MKTDATGPPAANISLIAGISELLFDLRGTAERLLRTACVLQTPLCDLSQARGNRRPRGQVCRRLVDEAVGDGLVGLLGWSVPARLDRVTVKSQEWSAGAPCDSNQPGNMTR